MEKKFCWEELRYTKSTDSDVRNASGFLIFQFIRRVLRVLLLKNSSTKSCLSIMENTLKGKKSSGEGKNIRSNLMIQVTVKAVWRRYAYLLKDENHSLTQNQ